jgi:hypothetical protein
VLRRLRAGVLATVAATAVLYPVVAAEAGHRIAAARHTDRAIGDIAKAQRAAPEAYRALLEVFVSGQVSLIGTGTEFANETAGINTDLTSAAEGNAAGRLGLTRIQFVQGQLQTCVRQADSAVRDYARVTQVQGTAGTGTTTGATRYTASDASARRQLVQSALDALSHDEERYDGRPIPGTGGLIQTLGDLRTLEEDALTRQRHSPWLDPAYVWPLLVGPAFLMLLLVAATGRVLARHFRRPLSPGLVAALLSATTAGVAGAVLVGLDAHRLAAHPRAVHPVTVTLALALPAAAAVLAYLAYRPRLAEYRFPGAGAR